MIIKDRAKSSILTGKQTKCKVFQLTELNKQETPIYHAEKQLKRTLDNRDMTIWY